MLENTNTKQFYPGPILNKTLDITDFLFKDPEQIHITYTYKNEDGSFENRELTYGTDYEVTKILPSDVTQAVAALTASTGRITLKASIDVVLGERLTAYRDSDIVQETQYPRTGPFPAASHEGALDYLTMQNQEQQEQIDRTLKVPITTVNFNGELPIPVAGKALLINENCTGFELSDYALDEAMESAKADASLAQAAATSAEAAKTSAEAAKTSAEAAKTSAEASAQAALTQANNAEIWAEGSDSQVEALGGVHSAKGWVDIWTKYQPTFDVTFYGAKGDGVTDDRIAIQSAINACIAKGGGRVYFPYGTYLINSFTTYDSKKCGLYINGSFVVLDGSENTFIKAGPALTNYSLDSFIIIKRTQDGLGASAQHVCINRLVLECNNKCVNGIDTNNSYLRYSKFSNLQINNVLDTACKLDCYLMDLTQVYCITCGTGIRIKGPNNGNSTSTLINQCYIGNYSAYGYILDNAYYSTFNACAADSSTRSGTAYYIKDGYGLNISGCGCEGAKVALKVDSARGLTINGFVAHAVGGATSAATADYIFEFGLVKGCTLAGVHYSLISGAGVPSYAKYILGITNEASLVCVLDNSFSDTTAINGAQLFYFINPRVIQFLDKLENFYENDGAVISNYKRGHIHVKELYRSTFDKSKFTIVGNVNISNNGIASNFGNASSDAVPGYITIPSECLSGASWQIACPISHKQSGLGGVFSVKSDTCLQINWNPVNKTLYYTMSSNGTSWDIGSDSFICEAIDTTKDCIFILTFTGTKYEFYFIQDNNKIPGFTIVSSAKIAATSQPIILGGNRVLGAFTDGEIDLKKAYTLKNGQEVFNGNKSGIAQIKQNDYTIVGEPTIDNYGIASNFSATDLLKTPAINLSGDCLIQFKLNTSDLSSRLQPILFLNDNNRIFISTLGQIGVFCKNTSTAGAHFVFFDTHRLNLDTDYLITLNIASSNFTMTQINLITGEMFTETQVLSDTFSNTSAQWSIGSDASRYLTGTLDLNALKIYSNGTMIYQPSLIIPFNKATSGIKIADAYYRDRVQTMQELYGFTNFYTLGEADFTLATCTDATIINSGDNFELTAGLTLKQWGTAESGQTVNIQAYKDTTYAISLANSNKTTSTFVANAAGDYITIGKVVL